MDLAAIPIFCDMDADERATALAMARQEHHPAGTVLFYEGDPAPTLYLLAGGRCAASRHTGQSGDYAPGTLLDPAAALGALPHREKITITEDATLLTWDMEALWDTPGFAATARRYLVTNLHHFQDRAAELEAPIHYGSAGADLLPGPFIFENATVILAFCEADLDPLRASLPQGLTVFRRMARQRDSVLLAFADFPLAYPENVPEARFRYTETTYFVPVRHGHRIGLFAPYIYPSTWEPILLGREIYGFPKRLGQTLFEQGRVSLQVDGDEHLALSWAALDGTDERHLVGALMNWLGLERRSAEVAFEAGDVLRKAMRLPPHRRIEVYNHKRILAADATVGKPVYAVNCLTQAIFGVLRWYQIARVDGTVLAMMGGPLADANLTLRDAYRTTLDMRLSTGRVLRDYRSSSGSGTSAP